MTNQADSDNLDNAQAPQIIVVVSPDELENRVRELQKISVTESSEAEPSAGEIVRLASDIEVRVRLFSDPQTAAGITATTPVRAVIIDNREKTNQEVFSETIVGRFLPAFLAKTSFGRTPQRRSIMVILPDSSMTPHHSYAVGSLQLGGVLIAPDSLHSALDAAYRATQPSETGKVALCLAGGGIEGMFYELGVLRALDKHLVNSSVVDFDIFSGISAGAILGAFLANGIRPDELTAALKGESSRIDPITRGMMFDPNVSEVASRLIGAAGDLLRGKWLRKPLNEALKVAPTALFSGDKMRWHLEKELSKPGMTNDFTQLKKEFYVGVTDQDSGTHVTFGEENNRAVPISHAVRASAAMTPYYPPEKIGGRYFIDGIFTRTINLDIAVANGAKFVICIDPLRPVQVEEAGYVSSRGGIFNTVQSIKSMIRTRLSEVIDRAEEAYPNVTVCVFSPTPRDLEQMSGTMMRFFYRTETEDMAFESASQRIRQEFDWFAADFQRHGFEIRR
jgi:NTE family protein